MSKIKFLAYYLPQYHPIPENDAWWGKGFTEWTNVAKAKPLFKGHEQPKLPGDLGFYDLRVPQVQEEQSKLALENGIDGFIYYQYWFGNNKFLLEKPAEQMLQNKNIEIPFSFCWANETWKGVWHGIDNPNVLIEQLYNGIDDYTKYFEYLLPFFKDARYIKINNKPMFHIYRMSDIPDYDLFLELFNNLAIQNGFEGIHFIATLGSAAVCENNLVYGKVGIDVFDKMRHKGEFRFSYKKWTGKLERKLKKYFGITNEIGKRKKPLIFDYQKGVANFNLNFNNEKYIPCVFPNWDNSARSGKKSLIFKNATPKTWQIHLEKTIKILISERNTPQIIVIKSWNEWAEGNYLEPDAKYGNQWLQIIPEVKQKYKID
jgi:hypothetical protein